MRGSGVWNDARSGVCGGDDASEDVGWGGWAVCRVETGCGGGGEGGGADLLVERRVAVHL